MDVGAEARLIGLIGRPVNEARVVIEDQHRPFGAWQAANPPLDRAVGGDEALAAGLPIHIGASIHRAGEDLMDRRVGRRHPADVGHAVGLQGEGQALGAEPQPDLARRPHFREAREDGADRAGDGLVGMEPDLALLLSPDEADGQAAAQGAALGLVANAAVEPLAQDVQFGLGHGAFEPEDQAVVEQGGVVDAIGIGEQGVGDATQVEEAIPVRVVARQARDLEAHHDAHLEEGDIGGELGEAGALGDAVGRDAEILVEDRDLVSRPAEVDGALDQGVLPLGRLAVVDDLRGTRLPNVDHGGALRVRRFDLRGVTHRVIPRGRRGPRRLSRTAAPRLRSRRRVGRPPARPTRGPRGRARPERSGAFARGPSSASGGDGCASPDMGRRRRRASTTVRAWSKSARRARLTRCA